MKQMATWKFSCSLHLLPADRTIVGVLNYFSFRRERIVFLHVIIHPEIVAMFLELALNLIGEIAQLHDDHERCHREEDVAPEQHVHVMRQVNEKGGELEAELDVVGDGTALVP